MKNVWLKDKTETVLNKVKGFLLLSGKHSKVTDDEAIYISLEEFLNEQNNRTTVKRVRRKEKSRIH